MSRSPLFMVGSLLVVGVACASTTPHVQRVRELPVEEASDEGHAMWEEARVLIGRFDDLRTPEYARDFPTSQIPLVNFMHMGGQAEYPEHAGLLSGKEEGRPIRRVGGLDTELPFLLARALPGERVMADDDPRSRKVSTWDYVVEGRVLQSTTTQHASVALGVVSLLGVPAVFSRHQLRLEITVASTDERAEPFFQQVYRFDRRMAEGLYYHHGSAQRLSRQAVQETVERIAADVVTTVADHQAQRVLARATQPISSPAPPTGALAPRPG